MVLALPRMLDWRRKMQEAKKSPVSCAEVASIMSIIVLLPRLKTGDQMLRAVAALHSEITRVRGFNERF
jgi:hypothetical protein